MLLDRNGPIADTWVALDPDAPVENDGDIIVAAARYAAERDLFLARRGRTGVECGSEIAIETLADDLAHIPLVQLRFDSHVDGRHYSNAVLLRERWQFGGEIRASGEFGRDQLFYLLRCGFETFSVADDVVVAEFLAGADDFSVTYQYAVDDRTPAHRLRGITV